MQLTAKNDRYQYPHRNVKIRQMSPIWFIIRRTDKISDIRHLSDYPTGYRHSFRRREQHKALSDSLAFENAPIQRLLNGQIVAPSRGANTHCKGLHCWIQRMLARIRHLLAGVRRRRGVRCLTIQLTIHSNKGMMWAPGLTARASQHEP